MLVFALSLAMIAAMVTATAVTLHNEAEQKRVKVVARKYRAFH